MGEQISESRFERVVREAHVDEFVRSFPDGLNTLVGQRGVMLSGGQKQRVAIARAIIRVSSMMSARETHSSSTFRHPLSWLEPENPHPRRSNERTGRGIRRADTERVGTVNEESNRTDDSAPFEHDPQCDQHRGAGRRSDSGAWQLRSIDRNRGRCVPGTGATTNLQLHCR